LLYAFPENGKAFLFYMKKYISCILLLCAFGFTADAQTTMQHIADGTQYTILKAGTGDKLKLNDVITFNVIQKTDKDSVLSTSYGAPQAPKMQVQAPESINDPVQLRLMEVLPFIGLNDSVLIKIPIDSLIKGHEESRPPFFPKGSFLNLYIKVINVQSLNDAIAERNAEVAKINAAEVADVNKYITDNKLIVKTTASGLKYTITKTGLKPKPMAGDTVFVNYTGKLLNGKIFDSSIQADAVKGGLSQPGRTYEPIKFVVGTGQVIKGWDEGLLLVNEGGKATLVIPSALAYGEQGGGDVIPPFSPLVFNVEITKVIRIKHAPATPAKKPLAKKHYPVKQN
jgi:FKBP-type peptidyl-prolyl cis-trans isomerase FkpA